MRRIAIVDDSATSIAWTTAQLERAGYEVVAHEASLGVTRFLSRTKPDLLLLDVNMRALNGDLLCRLLREREATRAIRIVLYSGLPDDSLAALAHTAGADGYLVKSNDASLLLRGVAHHILSLPSVSSMGATP